MKRCFDIVISITLLLLFSPIIGIVAVLVKKKIGSPVLFKQQRPGLNGKPFLLYKFRTMTVEEDKRGNMLPDKLRQTPLGMRLRKYSLDEFPQLWNVLKGEMSLVGPRPLLMEYLPLYTKEQFRRHEVLPGITGLAQVSGRNHLSWEDKFVLDVTYVVNQSFLLDVKIICLTFLKVLKPEGINQPGNVTMERFTGTIKSKVSGDNG